MRVLVLCTHNSARSQMAEAWLKHFARELGVDLEVHSAGTEKAFVKEEAKRRLAPRAARADRAQKGVLDPQKLRVGPVRN